MLQSLRAGPESFRIFFDESGKKISPWHDIPLRNGDDFNFVNEIPKYTKVALLPSILPSFHSSSLLPSILLLSTHLLAI